jgi:serine/threonine protein kinase
MMEQVKGGDLFEFLAAMEADQVSEDQAKYMFKQLLRAVGYLHEKDIVHRDLKPENVMLVDKSARPRLKITDFGEAKDLTGGNACKTHIGTELTMAPETFMLVRKYAGRASVKTIDGKIADVWGLGVILHVMLVIRFRVQGSGFRVQGSGFRVYPPRHARH